MGGEGKEKRKGREKEGLKGKKGCKGKLEEETESPQFTFLATPLSVCFFPEWLIFYKKILQNDINDMITKINWQKNLLPCQCQEKHTLLTLKSSNNYKLITCNTCYCHDQNTKEIIHVK